MPKYLKERLHKDGTKVWQVTYPTGEEVLSEDGKKRKKYHSKTFDKRGKAKAYLKDLEGRDDEGLAIVPTEDSIKEYFDYYFDSITLRENTIQSYRKTVATYLFPHAKPGGILRTDKLGKLTTKAIQRLYNHLRMDKKLSPRTVRYLHSILHSALDFAVDQKDLTRNPAKGVKLPKQTKKKMRPLTRDELAAFLEAARSDPYFAYFDLAVKTGARPGEMMGLKWSAVDLEGGSIHIRRTLVRDDDGWYLRDPKTKTSVRSIPISAATVEILKAHKKQQAELRMKHARHWTNHGFVFPDVFGGPLELRVFRRRHFKAVLKATADELHPPKEAKVDEDVMRQRESLLTTRLYDLRHTCATLMVKAGLNPKDVSERLGHKSVAFTLDTYVWPDEDSQRDATDRLEALIEGNES